MALAVHCDEERFTFLALQPVRSMPARLTRETRCSPSTGVSPGPIAAISSGWSSGAMLSWVARNPVIPCKSRHSHRSLVSRLANPTFPPSVAFRSNVSGHSVMAGWARWSLDSAQSWRSRTASRSFLREALTSRRAVSAVTGSRVRFATR